MGKDGKSVMAQGRQVSVFALKDEQMPISEEESASTAYEAHEEELTSPGLSSTTPVEKDGLESSKSSAVDVTTNGRATCVTCRSEFDSFVEQREHFGSDWHRYNVRRKERRQPTVNEDEFDGLSDSSSISASEDEEDQSEEEVERLRVLKSLPKVEFQSPSGEFIGVWKVAIPTNGSLRELRDLNKACVFLNGGGHFAGAVFGRKGKVLEHRSFHRYTTRKKQGGEQNFNDKAAKAKSAGASLRRYNLKMLREEIRETLADWSDHIRNADLIFIHAPGRGGRETFVGYEKSPLKGVELRRIPIPMRRATFKEAARVFEVLTSVYLSKTSRLPPATTPATSTATSKPTPSLSASAKKATPQVLDHKPVEKGVAHLKVRPPKGCGDGSMSALKEKSSQEDDPPLVPAVAPDVERLFRACCEDKLEEVLTDYRTEQLDAPFPPGCEFVDDGVKVLGESLTPLGVAASLNHAKGVRILLEAGANPVVAKPYTLATERPTRDAFRRFWGAHLDRWDYSQSGIPSPLTDEMDAIRTQKMKEKKKRAKERQKEKAREIAAAEEEKAAWERLTERERRALALERRMGTKMAACRWCGKSLAGLTPFERLNFKYCSTDCVQRHRVEIGR